jgi:hypothetical protein
MEADNLDFPVVLGTSVNTARKFSNLKDIDEYLRTTPDPKEILNEKEYKRPYFQYTVRTNREPTATDLLINNNLKKIEEVVEKSVGSAERAKYSILQKTENILDYYETKVRIIVRGYMAQDFKKLKKLVPKGFDDDIYKMNQVFELKNWKTSGGHYSDYFIHGNGEDSMVFEQSSQKAKQKEEEHTDVSALDAIAARFPGYLKMRGNVKMVYDPDTGLWTENNFGAFTRLAKATQLEKYSEKTSALQAMWAIFSQFPDDAYFFHEARTRSIGKLHFRDGIWDKNNNCRIEFTPDIYFVYSVPHDIPTDKPENVELVDKFHFTQPFPEPGVAEWLRQDMMKAIFGLGRDTMTIETGLGANGKSKRCEAFTNAFGQYVGTMSGDHITVSKNPNPAGASPQLTILRNKRIVYVSEPGKGMMMDMSLIKKITGGDPISCRDLYKEVETFYSFAKVHVLANDIPKFSECEEGFMDRRLRQLESNTRYLQGVDDNPEEQVYRADDDLAKLVINSPDALIWIMINEPLRQISVPNSIIIASRETIADQDDFKKAFFNSYEKWTDGKVFSKELTQEFNIAPRKLAGRMADWGFGKPKTVRIGSEVASGYTGVRKKPGFADY